ncbi:hypothetical protein Leryth_017119 [Lithospermum erythrorhizon]|nr:hypothetical protein Leryth_017119 [Lithospermum erythrorhizon]
MAGELATLAFYVFTGLKFKPEAHNPYLVIDEEEEEAALEMLKLQPFELGIRESQLIQVWFDLQVKDHDEKGQDSAWYLQRRFIVQLASRLQALPKF